MPCCPVWIIEFLWEKMRPENRFAQRTSKEQIAFILSDEGRDFSYSFGINVDGKGYPISVTGRAVKALNDESARFLQENLGEGSAGILRTAFLLFAGYVDAATTFAQNCGGGGSAPDQNWGRDKNEDDILWARRCFRKAREMVTTPVIRWGRRR